MNIASPCVGLSTDTRSMDALRASAARDPKAAIREAAKQFEALFMQQLMKSMRAATLSSGMLDNAGTQMGTEMLDTQFAQKMTGMPGGLSDAIVKQLERQMGGASALTGPGALKAPAASAAPLPSWPPRGRAPSAAGRPGRRCVRRRWPARQRPAAPACGRHGCRRARLTLQRLHPTSPPGMARGRPGLQLLAVAAAGALQTLACVHTAAWPLTLAAITLLAGAVAGATPRRARTAC